MTVRCGITHKHTKYTKCAKHTELLHYKYHKDVTYRIWIILKHITLINRVQKCVFKHLFTATLKHYTKVLHLIKPMTDKILVCGI